MASIKASMTTSGMVIVLALFVALFSAVPVSAQTMPCGIGGQTAVFGCLDWPPVDSTLSTAQPIPVSGWALSCVTAQQPSDLTVLYSMGVGSGAEVRRLDPSSYTIYLRGSRPDVTRAFGRLCAGVVRDHWGYTVVLKPGALPLGETVLALRFTDPTIEQLGVNYQQVQIRIEP